MLVGKRSAGSAFQVSLKDRCTMVVVEANGSHNSPGSILRSMGGAALIVAIQSLLKVIGQSDITLFWMGDALEQVNVFHFLPIQ